MARSACEREKGWGMKRDQRFDVRGFTGIVQLKGYVLMLDGKQYIGVAGKISILSDEEVAGFEARGGETANWIARVEGPSGTVNILGCQIRMVHQLDGDLPADLTREYYRVP